MILFVGGDLNAFARIEAACAASGRDLKRVSLDRMAEAIAADPPAAVLVDLDEVPSAPEHLQRTGLLDAGSPPVIGFFSHVDVDAGRKATEAGIAAVPRGRFWRELPETIAALGASPGDLEV